MMQDVDGFTKSPKTTHTLRLLKQRLPSTLSDGRDMFYISITQHTNATAMCILAGLYQITLFLSILHMYLVL